MKLSCLQKNFQISFNCFLYTFNSNSIVNWIRIQCIKKIRALSLQLRTTMFFELLVGNRKKKNLIETRFAFFLFIFIFNCVIFFFFFAWQKSGGNIAPPSLYFGGGPDVMLSSQYNVHVNIGIAQIKNSKCQKLLGINIDSKLSFEDHINHIYKKASAKLNALSRISYYMEL